MPSFKILVVDDDPLVCKGLKFNLEQAGYKVSTTSTAHTALQLSERNAFDVAILDIGLPDDNGLDLCKKLKAPMLQQAQKATAHSISLIFP